MRSIVYMCVCALLAMLSGNCFVVQKGYVYHSSPKNNDKIAQYKKYRPARTLTLSYHKQSRQFDQTADMDHNEATINNDDEIIINQVDGVYGESIKQQTLPVIPKAQHRQVGKTSKKMQILINYIHKQVADMEMRQQSISEQLAGLDKQLYLSREAARKLSFINDPNNRGKYLYFLPDLKLVKDDRKCLFINDKGRLRSYRLDKMTKKSGTKLLVHKNYHDIFRMCYRRDGQGKISSYLNQSGNIVKVNKYPRTIRVVNRDNGMIMNQTVDFYKIADNDVVIR